MKTNNKDLQSNSFIKRTTQIILDNLGNEQFGVELLAKISGISRSQLYKNIKQFTGKSASQFIRDIKLEEASKQLKEKELSVAQVAYNVGFGSPAYFATCFKDYFGYSPSEVKTREDENHTNEQLNRSKSNKSKNKWVLITALALVGVILSVYVFNATKRAKINKQKTIAVIRFDNMTDDLSNQPFVDGLGEEIINSLYKIHKLKVTARNSSFLFNKDDDVGKISKFLNVNYILEGSVRKEDDKYRITTQLIDATDGHHLWSETFDRKEKDIFFLQEEISRIVAHELEIRLSEKEDIAISTKITSDSLAYQLYNESIATAASNKIEGIKIAVELMNQAIEKDSTFALAHARIVDLYRQNNFVGELGWNETTELMKIHVNKAMQLDPTLGEAYIAKGYLAYRKPNYEEAMNSFITAVELAPNEPRAHFALAGTYIVFNRFKERYLELERAFELDPLNSQFSLMAAQYFYYNKKDFNRGIQVLKNSIEAFPDNDLAACHLEMYRASLPNGDLVGAFKNYFEIYRKTPDDRRALNWLFCASSWLDLKPIREILNNKMRLKFPTNIHTFWNMYTNNALQGRFAENIDLVEFWSNDQQLNSFDEVNYLAESYINSNKPELAKQIIEEAIPNILDASYLINAKKYNSLENVRLDILEKYIIAQRNLDNHDAVKDVIQTALQYINEELYRLNKDKILDYRFELYLKLVKASINDNVDEVITVFEKAFFEDKHRIWMYDELLTFARYNRFRDQSTFIAFVNRIEKEIQLQRNEVITYLKQEGHWDTSWDE